MDVPDTCLRCDSEQDPATRTAVQFRMYGDYQQKTGVLCEQCADDFALFLIDGPD